MLDATYEGLRGQLRDAELESRPLAEGPDDLLEDYLIPVFLKWHDAKVRDLRERVEKTTGLDEDHQSANGECLLRADVLRVFDA